ncbi:Dipeptidyl aminopeptidase [Yamadazyma tenuis]|uniref:Dipeptidyl aminopeptidase n=1 Tax=Candida tenuis (strain ATCC 10573 / BCRC 21748 / CBS 615 / JCM 9827 / NBRC 10315 / NRRL Y-1498 / VKM Y-70) TaxID=590646 RepID=G3B8K3_CANTC|nr:uncharacterized protein CANTEDRAFT_124841 [Yamadazyma tenuis ATCC 10573]EGV61753.1 hypothetical protein CANTEDRAFT_124841 [Yamadazyma tenuis ATCC 10573]WEJ92982.1 Dipeptidyl aminopeptidase [Yamadazyma tenuis]
MTRNPPVEEYEMTDNLLSADISGSASVDTPTGPEAESDSDQDSVTSTIFDQLASTSDETDFHNDEVFQTVLQQYKGVTKSPKMCLIISGIGFLVWVVSLIVYANVSVSDITSKWKWQTTVQMSGFNVTLSPYSPQRKNLTMTSMRNGDVLPTFKYVRWLNRDQYPTSKSGAGYFMTRGPKGSYVLQNQKTAETDMFIENIQFAYENNFFYVEDVILNPARPINDPSAYHVLVTDSVRQWRHSSFALYWLYRPATDEYIPIQPANLVQSRSLIKLHFVEFSPDGQKVLFGVNHDLYVYTLETKEITTITNDGSPDIFNGKPDWVYEEEILSSDRSVWWSPDSENIVYSCINNTGVFEYEIDYYVKDANDIGMTYSLESEHKLNGVSQYPIKKNYKYPKPGTTNPVLGLKNFNFKSQKHTILKPRSQWSDFILYDASWIDNDHFLVKISDRTSSIQSKQVLTISTNKFKEIDEVDAAIGFGGWYDKYSTIVPVNGGYLDKIVHKNRTHLAFYETPLARAPRMLTSSSTWDVLDSAPVVYNANEQQVYTLANIKGSMDVHLIGVTLDSKVEFVLGNDKEGKYSFTSDRDGQYILLEYGGPEIPYQKIISTGDLNVHDNMNDYLSEVKMVSFYDDTKKAVDSYNLPTKVFRTIQVNHVPINVLEILPPNFNPKRKYPLLVNAYGGPGSQSVTKNYEVGFEEVVSCQLDAIVLKIDPRGTDGYGWETKTYGLKHIGHWEPKDIITLTSEYIHKNKLAIDKEAVAIWGWSYGGFTTLKTLETDKGKTFKYGMAVAPVTNFLFYNSFYTERYMKSPKDNQNYLTESLISDYSAFKSLNRFLIMHGTADDNVHIQNSLWLLDKFNSNGTENYDVHFFTDNDHGISFHNSDVIVYDKLFHWVQDAFSGKFIDFV